MLRVVDPQVGRGYAQVGGVDLDTVDEGAVRRAGEPGRLERSAVGTVQSPPAPLGERPQVVPALVDGLFEGVDRVERAEVRAEADDVERGQPGGLPGVPAADAAAALFAGAVPTGVAGAVPVAVVGAVPVVGAAPVLGAVPAGVGVSVAVRASESTTCAFVPPKPKAETAARRGPGVSGQGRAVRTSVASPTFPSGEETGRSTPMVGGITPSSMARTTFRRLLRPPTVSRWPMLPLTDPSRGTSPWAPKNSATDSASVVSPTGVPVAWHSR